MSVYSSCMCRNSCLFLGEICSLLVSCLITLFMLGIVVLTMSALLLFGRSGLMRSESVWGLGLNVMLMVLCSTCVGVCVVIRLVMSTALLRWSSGRLVRVVSILTMWWRIGLIRGSVVIDIVVGVFVFEWFDVM